MKSSKDTYREFVLPLVASDASEYPDPPFRGNHWHVTYQPSYNESGQPRCCERVNGEFRVCPELVLSAPSYERAIIAASIIAGSVLLVTDLGPWLQGLTLLPRPKTPQCDELERAGMTPRKPSSFDGIPLACMIAARASFRNKYIYAIAKLQESYNMMSIAGIDTNPRYAPNGLGPSKVPTDHVIMAYAIVLAYAAIEELGLEVRSGKEKRSRLDDGSWNPTVLEDLEARLLENGTDLSEPVLWQLRARATPLESEGPAPSGVAASWSAGRIRDRKITVTDALGRISWLRSKVSAHKFSERSKDLVRLLSPHDVILAQNVACRLILEGLGYWRWGYPQH